MKTAKKTAAKKVTKKIAKASPTPGAGYGAAAMPAMKSRGVIGKMKNPNTPPKGAVPSSKYGGSKTKSK